MIPAPLVSTITQAAFNKLKDDAKENSDGLSSAIAATSLAEIARLTDVEFITVIDNALTVFDSTTDVLKYINSLIAGWYISSAGIITKTGSIETVKMLQKLNPSKSPSYALANSILSAAGSYSRESYDDGEQQVTFLPTSLPTISSFSMEADQPKSNDKDNKDGEDGKNGNNNKSGNDKDPRTALSGFRPAGDLTTVSNLSLGQSVVLNLSDGHATKDVNVNIRLITVPVNSNFLKTVLVWSDKDNRIKSRLSAWRAGELKFWRDVVFMRDIFTERKRILMNDKSTLLTSMLGRTRDSMLHSVMTATPSVGTMSSILVISSDNLRAVEREHLNGPISNHRIRQNIMNATGLMIIAVVDPMSELVTIYTHTQSLPSEYSIKQLKGASKGGASDLGEIIKLMKQDQMPNF